MYYVACIVIVLLRELKSKGRVHKGEDMSSVLRQVGNVQKMHSTLLKGPTVIDSERTKAAWRRPSLKMRWSKHRNS